MNNVMMLCLLVVVVIAALAAPCQAIASNSSTVVPLGAACYDGSVPLNSIQQRCDTTPQLHWAGRKCDNATYSCPERYNCNERGYCCLSGLGSTARRNLCRQITSTNRPATLVTGGSCSSDSDCAGGRTLAHQCCSGRCVLYIASCHLMLTDFLRLRATGKSPRQHLPICKSDGSFERIQTDPRFGVSWCVNESTGLALRSGCCIPSDRPHICPPGQRVNACPRDMCSMEVCLADPSAKCRVNPCGSGCRIEFVDSKGRIVNCSQGVAGCSLKHQKFFETLARMHRWDQTMPEQQYHQEDVASSAFGSGFSHLERCQRQLCVRYDRSKLEPEIAAVTGGSECPLAEGLGYHCDRKCRRRSEHSDCGSGRKCCFTGCGHECVKPVSVASSETCSAVISSGHCPITGCHRMCKRFGWDAAKRSCRPFWYAGAGGNNNRYSTWSECMFTVQHCHTDVLIALPWRPNCAGRSSTSTTYTTKQTSDNGFAWCVSSSGQPTAGSLHAANIVCRRDGSLLQDYIYRKEELKYIAKCPSGNPPAWCHTVSVNASCQAPGVMTFADACDNCRIVHINEDGDRVACPTAAAVCSASAKPCTSPQPRFAYNASSQSCGLAPSGPHSCSSNGSLSDHSAFSREDYCLHSCSAGWCKSSPSHFFPDLCVRPSCAKAGAVCVADDCSGVERYFFLENGTEVTECRRSSQPLDLTAIASCGSSTAWPPGSPPPGTPPSGTRPPGTPPSGTRPPGTPPPGTRPPGTPPSGTRPPGTPPPGTRPPGTRPPGTPPPGTRPPGTPSPGTRPPGTRPPPTTTARTSPTTTAADTISGATGLCKLRSLLADSKTACNSKGQYMPKQCNSTHCYCVVSDSGLAVGSIAAVSIARSAALSCPDAQTTELDLNLRFEADFNTLLPSEANQIAFKVTAASQLARAARLQPKNANVLTVRAGSIVVALQLSKKQNDEADLPAAAFQLKTAALEGTLSLRFNGKTLRASSQQDFNEKSTNTAPLTGTNTNGNGESGGVSVGGIIAGIAAALAVVAVAVGVFIFIRRKQQFSDRSSSQIYDTMSNASSSNLGGGGADFENQIYANEVGQQDVYDNIDGRISSSA